MENNYDCEDCSNCVLCIKCESLKNSKFCIGCQDESNAKFKVNNKQVKPSEFLTELIKYFKEHDIPYESYEPLLEKYADDSKEIEIATEKKEKEVQRLQSKVNESQKELDDYKKEHSDLTEKVEKYSSIKDEYKKKQKEINKVLKEWYVKAADLHDEIKEIEKDKSEYTDKIKEMQDALENFQKQLEKQKNSDISEWMEPLKSDNPMYKKLSEDLTKILDTKLYEIPKVGTSINVEDISNSKGKITAFNHSSFIKLTENKDIKGIPMKALSHAQMTNSTLPATFKSTYLRNIILYSLDEQTDQHLIFEESQNEYSSPTFEEFDLDDVIDYIKEIAETDGEQIQLNVQYQIIFNKCTEWTKFVSRIPIKIGNKAIFIVNNKLDDLLKQSTFARYACRLIPCTDITQLCIINLNQNRFSCYSIDINLKQAMKDLEDAMFSANSINYSTTDITEEDVELNKLIQDKKNFKVIGMKQLNVKKEEDAKPVITDKELSEKLNQNNKPVKRRCGLIRKIINCVRLVRQAMKEQQ